MSARNLITVVTACFNEEDNVREVYKRVRNTFHDISLDYEHIFIDNASKDSTVEILRDIAANDSNIKVIINNRNFGHIRSPTHGIFQATGDAVISLVADLQDPPELIPELIEAWRSGYKIAVGVKQTSDETFLKKAVRKSFYRAIDRLADTKTILDFTGFGIYDRSVINVLKGLDDPYPYFRGLISELGYKVKQISYHQPIRKKGITKNNIFSLFDMALLAVTSHSLVPLRLATFIGITSSIVSFVIGITYLVHKLIFWDVFELGLAPMLIGQFFLGSVILLFLGIIGEYIGSIHRFVARRPLVIEKERINF